VCRTDDGSGVPPPPGKVGHDPTRRLWYNRSMNGSRLRTGALVLGVLFLLGAVANSPAVRPSLRRVAVQFGLLQPIRVAKVGQPLVPIGLRGLDGSPMTLGDRSDRGLVVNVFTSWCASCNEEMPALERAAPELARAGIDVVGIDQGESGSRVARFLASYGIQYPVYIDPDNSTNTRLGARVIPTTLFIDRHGVVRYIHVGPLDDTSFLALARTFN